jgi:hypothetical protein
MIRGGRSRWFEHLELRVVAQQWLLGEDPRHHRPGRIREREAVLHRLLDRPLLAGGIEQADCRKVAGGIRR